MSGALFDIRGELLGLGETRYVGDPHRVAPLSEAPTLYRITDDRGCSPYRKRAGQCLDLPADNRPGAWSDALATDGAEGWYVTSTPDRWPSVPMRVFEVEGRETCGPSRVSDAAVRLQLTPNGSPMHLTFDEWQVSQIRLVRERPDLIPPGWRATEAFFLDTIPRPPGIRPDQDPPGHWYAAPTRARAARWAGGRVNPAMGGELAALLGILEVEGDATRAYAAIAAVSLALMVWDAPHDHDPTNRDMRRDMILRTMLAACDGLPVSPELAAAIVARWDAWRAGYGCYGIVDGRPLVYRQVA